MRQLCHEFTRDNLVGRSERDTPGEEGFAERIAASGPVEYTCMVLNRDDDVHTKF
jgi:hypothetical protein